MRTTRKGFLGMSALAAVCSGCGTFTVGRSRGRRPAPSATRSASVCHIANIAARLGRKSVRWNPVTERFVNDAEADRMIFVKHHNGWSI